MKFAIARLSLRERVGIIGTRATARVGEGLQRARAVDEYLMGSSSLPR